MRIAAFLTLILTGPGLLLLGIRTLRHRIWQDGVPLAELLIDRAAGIEPPPRTAWDRRFAHCQAWMLVVFGTFFTLCLAAATFSLLSE